MADRRDFLKTGVTAMVGSTLFRRRSGAFLSRTAREGGREYHVSVTGDDANDGSVSKMLRTITEAAKRAQPGDVITVHEGIYRERIDPPRGGTSADMPIVYQAAIGERAEITGAEVVNGWTKMRGDVWTVKVPNSTFGSFNPYSDDHVIGGDWFNPEGRVHHLGAVYLDGNWLMEAAKYDDLFAAPHGIPLWFGTVEGDTTTLWAQFRRINPNEHLTEINARPAVFYPSKTGMNYITVRGFTMCKAATQWAPPTAEQIGLIGANWSKGWVIENNDISHSICSGISLGKYGDEFDNTSANSAEGYVATIHRATAHGWSKDNVGHHLVQGNRISHCEQAGIVGSLGCVFSRVIGNTIHDIHVRKLFSGAEQSGLKFHGAVDVEIAHNHIYRCHRAIWLDWLAQGTRVHRNLLHDNEREDVFVEVDHGPFVVENNIMLSRLMSVQTLSRGAAFIHNLFCAQINVTDYDGRETPYLKPHSTEVAGLHDNPSGDTRFYNNLFIREGDLTQYNRTTLPMYLAGNVFLDRAQPCTQEANPWLDRDLDTALVLEPTALGWQLDLIVDPKWPLDHAREIVTTASLGRAAVPDLPFVRADDSSYTFDTDFTGEKRSSNPFPGPFEVAASSDPLKHVRLIVAPA